MTTEDDFQDGLDANPGNHFLRLVFADWLEERDDPRAAGYRAMGENNLYPSFYRGLTHPWTWWIHRPASRSEGRELGCMGPTWWGLLQNGVWGFAFENAKDYKTRREAEDDAALAWLRVEDRSEVEA